MLRTRGLALLALIVMIGLPFAGRAQTPSVTLTPSVASPQMLGTPVTWTAAVQNAPAGHTYDYQYTVTFNSQPQIVRDFNPTATFLWVPHTVEGAYQVSVVVRGITTAPYVAFAPVSANFTLQPWVTAPLGQAVNPTSHPLVALFSGPPCTVGHQLLVRFHPVSAETSMTTSLIPCSQQSANFLVAGMYPSTQYLMHWEEYFGASLVNTGTDLPFTTGPLPSSYAMPQFQVTVPPTAHDSAYPVILWHFLTSGGTATDLSGNVIWYAPGPPFMARMEAGGNFFSYGGGVLYGTTVTQYDLAGNAVLQTNVEILNEQLAAKRYPTINAFNTHEARHLPDGNLLLLGARDVVSTSAQGGTPSNPVDIVGDVVLVLDHNLQLVWAWDSFAHEDINRAATQNDKSTAFNPDFTIANDWLHTNFAQGTADGNIILSQRSQDWVIKINYANATGDGRVIWHMGAGDDFTLLNPDTSQTCGNPNVFPWFTHQHDSAFQFEESGDAGGGTIMTVFDDGNTRAAECSGTQNSRGMILFVNEAARQVYMETLADLGAYAFALGSGQVLAPGDGSLYASYDTGLPNAQSTEVNLAGQIVYQMEVNQNSYRAYRMQNLDTPTFPFTATGVYVSSSTPLQFADISTGATAVLPLTITNFGLPGTVTVGTSINSASYTVLNTTQNTCLAGITAGQSCILPVEFNPSSAGDYSGLLTLTPSAGPAPALVSLNGSAGIPQISGISPSYGAPSAVINLAGNNFGATQGSGYVTVGGALSEVTAWSNNAITIRVPSRATTGNVVVIADAMVSNGAAFTFYSFPTITNVSATSGTVGSLVTITGTNLLDGGGNAAVTFNGTPATVASDTSGSIHFAVPTGASSGRLLVEVNGVTLVALTDFTPTVPQISGIGPNYGAPSAVISISGNNFGATQGSGYVTVGGALSQVTAWSNNAIAIRVPSNGATGNVIVTALGTTSNGVPFTFYPFPTITSVSGTTGTVGSLVTISGTNLLDGGNKAIVTFNGTPATIVSETSGSIQVAVPTSASSGRLLVVVNGVTLVALGDFTPTVPQISGISPNYGAPAALINISGSNFGATQGNSFVTVGGALSYIVSWSNTAIAIQVPSRATTGNIVVTSGIVASNGAAFTLYPFPVITAVSTASGAVGSLVTITGTNLLDGEGNAAVTFNGTSATISSDTSGGIQVTVPTGASSGRLLVEVNGVALVALGIFTITSSSP